MATSRILLDPTTAILPASNPAVLSAAISSSATATTNTPKPTYKQLQFNKDTDQSAMWTFMLPADYLSGGTLALMWAAAVNTNNVVWKGGVAVGTAASTDVSASTFLGADLTAATLVPATVGLFKTTSLALTMTGVQASKWLTLFVGRDADNGSDTAAGDAYLLAAELSYTS